MLSSILCPVKFFFFFRLLIIIINIHFLFLFSPFLPSPHYHHFFHYCYRLPTLLRLREGSTASDICSRGVAEYPLLVEPSCFE